VDLINFISLDIVFFNSNDKVIVLSAILVKVLSDHKTILQLLVTWPLQSRTKYAALSLKISTHEIKFNTHEVLLLGLSFNLILFHCIAKSLSNFHSKLLLISDSSTFSISVKVIVLFKSKFKDKVSE